MKEKIKEKAFSGIRWTGLSTVAGAILQILKISILARFLSQEDFGLMALAMVVISFSQTFADGGVSNAIIYRQDITDKQLSSLYWLNVLVGFAVFVLILVFTPFFSSFYSEPLLNIILPITALTVLFQSFSFQYRAIFEKELMFNKLAKIELLSRFVSFVVAVFLAYEGFGVFSLVYSVVAMYFLEAVLIVFEGFKIHRPEFYFSFKDIKFFVKFGSFQLGERITNYFSSQIDIILIGKILGTGDVGVYSVMKQLVMRPAYILNPIITRITFPVMSKFQDDINQLKNIYLKTVKYVASVNFPVYTLMIVLAPEIVYIFLGERWLEYTTIFQLLSVYYMFRAIGNPVGSLLLARGRPDIEFYWNILMLIYVPLWVVAGSYYGLVGISLALALSHILLVFIDWFFLVKKMCGAEFFQYHMSIAVPFAISVFVAFVVYSVSGVLENVYIKLIFSSVFGGICYVLISVFANKDFIEDVKSLLGLRTVQ